MFTYFQSTVLTTDDVWVGENRPGVKSDLFSSVTHLKQTQE